MRRQHSVAALGAAAALLLPACGTSSPTGPPSAPTTISATSTFTVSGVVHESLAGGGVGPPVRGVRVEVLAIPGVFATAVTGPTGEYHVDGVAGTFQIRGSKAGYDTATTAVNSVTAPRIVDLALTPIPQSLSGTITEAPPTETRPLGGARVEVVSGANTGKAAVTDKAGRYVLDSMWGEFDVLVSLDAYVSRMAHVDMSGSAVRGDVQLGPTPRTVTESFVNNFAPSAPFRVVIPVHNDGEIAIADWWAYGFEEGDGATLQIWEDGRLLAQTFVERSIPRHMVVLRAPAAAGRTYEVREVSIFWWYEATVTHPS